MATRARTAKPTSAEDVERPDDDDVPSFTTPKAGAVYDGPVLFRVDRRQFRMVSDRSFGASLLYLRRLDTGTSVRQAEFALLDYVAGPEATEQLIRASAADPARWTAVVNRALQHVLGRLKEDPGN